MSSLTFQNMKVHNEKKIFLGFYWRQFMTDTGCEQEAWKYLAVVVPISIMAGPIGSFVASFLHRQVLASFIYFLDTLALVM